MEKFKLPIALFAVGFVLIIGGIFLNAPKTSKEKVYPKESLVQNRNISVDVSGAVKTPGVYQLKEGMRIADALSSAGGILEEANKEYISKYLNMAQKLADGTKIYIPFAGEQGPAAGGVGGGSVAGTNIGGKVNINTASQSDLEALPGVGPITASKIISNRPYQTLEELFEKKSASKAVFEKIKDSISLY